MSDSIHSQRHYQQTLSTNLWNNQSCLRGRDFAKTKCLFGWKCDRRVIGEIVSCEVIKTNVHKLDKRIMKPKDASNHHPCDSWTSSAALLWPGLCCHHRRNTPRITLLLHIWGFYWRYVRKEATVHQCHQFLFVLVAFIWQPEEKDREHDVKQRSVCTLKVQCVASRYVAFSLRWFQASFLCAETILSLSQYYNFKLSAG